MSSPGHILYGILQNSPVQRRVDRPVCGEPGAQKADFPGSEAEGRHLFGQRPELYVRRQHRPPGQGQMGPVGPVLWRKALGPEPPLQLRLEAEQRFPTVCLPPDQVPVPARVRWWFSGRVNEPRRQERARSAALSASALLISPGQSRARNSRSAVSFGT